MNLVNKISNLYFSKRALPFWGILGLDCAIVAFSLYFSDYLFYNGLGFAIHFRKLTIAVLCTLVVSCIFFKMFHTYCGIIRFSSFKDLLLVINATISICVVVSIADFCFGKNGTIVGYLPDVTHVILAFALATFMMWIVRVLVKAIYDSTRYDDTVKRAFIYGVRQGGIALAKTIQNQVPANYKLVGFISPEQNIDFRYLLGIKVYPSDKDVVKYMQEEGVKVLAISPLQVDTFRENTELVDEITDAGIKILMMPQAEEWDGKSEINQSQLKEVDIEDLLPRDQINVDMDAIGSLLRGRRILITGAAGSIGSEMVRQIAIYHPAEMILVDQAETPMHDMRLWCNRFNGTNGDNSVQFETIVVSITDKEQMEYIFSHHRPDYVFHAAAYKHVPMMEDNPAQAVRNNVRGTRIIADLAVKYGTKKFVMISTDKAVNPTNVMGCSKRICEIYCQSLNQAIQNGTCPIEVVGDSQATNTQHPTPNTQFVTTRFGNVLGSNGSVIPLFREQIRKGGPITVTHPDIIRFFMLIPEACKLVLEAGTMGKGGEIFIFDMGKPVRIVDLAKRMIRLSGAKNIEIKFTGLRDGEKLYEEVLNDAEGTVPTVHPKIKVAKVREYDYLTACENEDALLQVSYTQDDMQIVKKMKEIVPEYKSQVSKYEVLDK